MPSPSPSPSPPSVPKFRSSSCLLPFLFLHSIVASLIPLTAAESSYKALDNFLQCFNHLSAFSNRTTAGQVIYYPDTPSYNDVFLSSINNPRFLSSTPKPILIVAPTDECHVQASVFCCKMHGLQMRVRSGGHDYEGLSYRSNGDPFIIVDLNKLRSISVDVEHATAWVQAGATLGELYYSIAMKSGTMGFPAGLCPTIGLGGHFSSGGFGAMVRKYGLAVDHVVDARLVDSNGLILNRESMGEDLFWAIRGGGGASFGVILSYEIQLVQVPPIVTVFTVNRALRQEATALVTKWQQIAHEMDENLFVRAIISTINDENNNGERTIQVSFNSLFLGRRRELLGLIEKSFPDLGLEAKECIEMSWIESILYIAGYSGRPTETLLDRKPRFNSSFKAKSDFVSDPIPETGWEGVWRWFLEGVERPAVIVDPFGGKMNEVPESDTPFPHRKGTLYNIQYVVRWVEEGDEASKKHMDWLRRFYRHMRPFVSKHPRAAYLGYIDLDLGSNKWIGKKSFSNVEKASVWGRRYFKDNFYRLSRIKGEVDPMNFFRNEQSIPALAIN